MQEVLDLIQKMRKDCGWDKTDNLATLIKSVSIESAELLETIQWDENNVDICAVRFELADVLMYALAIAIDQNWDVKNLIEEKISDVYRRYPHNND